jgi:hypothetical protein
METFGWYRLTGLLHKKYLGRGRVEVLPGFSGRIFFAGNTIFILFIRLSPYGTFAITLYLQLTPFFLQ